MSDEELEKFIWESDALIKSMEPGVPPAVPRHSRRRKSREGWASSGRRHLNLVGRSAGKVAASLPHVKILVRLC
jgi:hypothetical protein